MSSSATETQRDNKDKSKNKKKSATGKKGAGGKSYDAKKAAFFKHELKGIVKKIDELNEKHRNEKPKERDHIPMTYNTLGSYADTHVPRYVILGGKHEYSFINKKNTSINVCDPWVSLELDEKTMPKKHYFPKTFEEADNDEEDDSSNKDKENRGSRSSSKCSKKSKDSKRSKSSSSSSSSSSNSSKSKGSDKIKVNKGKQGASGIRARRSLYFSDVPLLRKELKEKYSINATERIEEDKKVTKDHYNKSGMEKYTELRDTSKKNMRSAIFAYSQNTEGSKIGIKECIKETDDKEKEKNKKKQRTGSAESQKSDGHRADGNDNANKGHDDKGKHKGHAKRSSRDSDGHNRNKDSRRGSRDSNKERK